MSNAEERKSAKESLDAAVEQLSKDGNVKLKALAGGKATSEQREQVMQAEMPTIEAASKEKLSALEAERDEIDKLVTALEEEKRESRMKLEHVSARLVTAQEKQREHMQRVDELRQQQEAERGVAVSKISEEATAQKIAIEEEDLTRSIMELARRAHSEVGEKLSTSTSTLETTLTQLKGLFADATKDHVNYLTERLSSCGRVAESCIQALQSHDNSSSVISVLGESSPVSAADQARGASRHAELRAELERKLRRAIDAVQVLWLDAEAFKRGFGDDLEGKGLWEPLEAQYLELEAKLKPWDEKLQAAAAAAPAPADPASAALPTLDAAMTTPRGGPAGRFGEDVAAAAADIPSLASVSPPPPVSAG